LRLETDALREPPSSVTPELGSRGASLETGPSRDFTQSKSRERWAVTAVLATGFAYRLAFLLVPLSFDDDTTAYMELARNWFRHGVYGFSKGASIEPTLVRLPGYPLFLGAVFSVFGEHLRAAVVIQALADMAACWLLWDCARREVSRRAGWAVLLLAVFCPFTAVYAVTGLTECLSIFCIALAIWALARLVRAARSGGKARGPLMALAAAMAYGMLLRPDGVLLTAAFCGGLFWYSRRVLGLGRAVRLALFTGVLAVLPLAPWTVRNYRTLDVLQPLAPRYVNNPDEFVPAGFFRWMRTWSVNFVDAGTVFWNLDGTIDPEDVPARACSTAMQCQETQALIAEHNAQQTVNPELDAKFAVLAAERIHERPLRYYVVLPAWRVADMWLWPRTERFPVNIWWYAVKDHPEQSAIAIGMGLLNLGYLGLAVWGFVRRRVPLGGVLLLYIVLRCCLLGTMENPEQRYTLMMFPMVFLAAGCAVAGGSPPATGESAG
jgi:4-amino-4-deoxy-L-arabinose transferase-like glycosyltransferase